MATRAVKSVRKHKAKTVQQVLAVLQKPLGKIPAEERGLPPADLASRVDHYLYEEPKKP